MIVEKILASMNNKFNSGRSLIKLSSDLTINKPVNLSKEELKN